MKELLLQHVESRGDSEYCSFNTWMESLGRDDPGNALLYSPLPRHRYDDLLSEIKEVVRGYQQAEIFVACFSAVADSLSQWRAYAHKSGYAIGFDPAALSHIGIDRQSDTHAGAPSSLPIFGVVRYIENALDSSLKEIIDAALWNRKTITYSAMHAIFAAHSPFIKDASFGDEKEWRICCRYPVFDDALKFRSGMSHLVPYIELPVPHDAIKKIMVGPGPNIELGRVNTMSICMY
jgi:hypothetical protein